MKPEVPPYQPPSWFERLDWAEVFGPEGATSPIHVDLGAGDGGFVLARAAAHPQTRFLAVERLLGRVRKIHRKARRLGLDNLRTLRIEGAYAAEHLLPERSVAALTILFPDPWPKRRHHKNRLVQTTFLEHGARSLRPDGWLAIKTDDADYFAWISEALDACASLRRWKEADPAELLPEPTDFERHFLKEGRTIHFLAARLR